MKEIALSNGMKTTVDDNLFDFLNRYKWQAVESHGRWYARRGIKVQGKVQFIPMWAMVIPDAMDGSEVDHIDRNPLNNTRENLRFCSHAQNCANRTPGSAASPSRHSSTFKGVSFYKPTGTWVAHCGHEHIGYFNTQTSAAIAYNAAAIQKYGKTFATLNDIPGQGKISASPHLLKKSPSSQFWGVNKRSNKWRAAITHQGARFYLGSFFSEANAALAYNIKAQELGSKKLNSIPDSHE